MGEEEEIPQWLRWREDDWYVLQIAQALDVTPQAVLDMEWPEIQKKLGEYGTYRVALGMRCQGNPDFYTKRHLEKLRQRQKL